jgi:hypothetical protein
MEFNLLDKYNALNSFSKEKVNEFVNKELDKLFGEERTRTYENQEDYTHVEKGILSISYNDLIQSTQGVYNQFAQQLQCGPQEFAGAIYMKLIHDVQELGFKTIAVGNFGSIILKGNGEPIVAVDETAPYDYQPDQNNHVYGIRTKDLNGDEIFIAFVDYRLANHIAEFTEADVHALDLNTLSYPYYCKEDKAQLRSPVTRMSIQGNLVGYIMSIKEVSAVGDFILGYIHDYDKEIITENQKVVCTYHDEDYEDFCVYDFKIEGFAQKATSPEAVEEILKDIREQISKEGVVFCHVEPIMMAVDDNVSYFRMLVWSTAPNRQRYLPPVVVEEMLVYSSWADGTTFLPTIELAAHVGGEIDELINENELASDMMSHLESVRGFITLGYLACEINHFLKLTEKENWSDKSYVPYSVNGVTFSMNYLDAKNQRIIVVNDMVYEGLILKSSEGKPVSEIGDEYVTVINGSTVNRVLILDEEEREEQIVDDALFSGPSSDVESGYYYGTHLVFKGKVTYQEVMGKHEKLLYGVTVEGESFKHPAMINGNPMFLLTYVKASDLGENAKYWEAESEGAYYINNPISSIYNMSTYETRIDAK